MQGTTREPPSHPTSTHQGIFLRLSDAQVAQVVQEAGDGGIKTLLSVRLTEQGMRKSVIELLDDPVIKDPGISLSVVLGWVVLAAFTPPGAERGIKEIAKELAMSNSTTHRYVNTLRTLGLLEQTEKRQYRLAMGDVGGGNVEC